MGLTVHPDAVLNWRGETSGDVVLKDMMKDYDTDDLGDGILLAALYNYADYDGSAFVLIYKPDTGELFKVNDEHCSCDDLEGHWSLETTNFAALQMRSFDRLGSPEEKEAILEAVWAVTNGDYPQGAA